MRGVTTTRVAFALVAVAACTAIAILGSGCSPSAAPLPTSVVHVTERDFKISAPARLPAGDVVLHVRNRGPDSHELLVIKLGPKGLPFRGDGLTVDEDAVKGNEAGVLEPGESGSVRDLDVRLTPGRYALLCNMSGHYLGGMERIVVVR